MFLQNWVFLSIIAMFITGLGTLSLNYITKTKYDDNTILAITFILMGLFSIVYLILNRDLSYKFIRECNYSICLFILFFSLLLIGNNYILNIAFKVTPNISYTHMIINLNVILSVIVGYFVYRQKINIKCFFGILLALFGISIIILYK